MLLHMDLLHYVWEMYLQIIAKDNLSLARIAERRILPSATMVSNLRLEMGSDDSETNILNLLENSLLVTGQQIGSRNISSQRRVERC
jgi:hypothetical protein